MTQKIDGPPPAPAPRPVASPATATSPAAPAAPAASAPSAQGVAARAGGDNVRLTGESSALRALQREAKAGPPPLDMAKIEALRAALSSGTYRINPQDIAKRLDALERELSI